MPGFNVQAARQAGYSDDEILSHLTSTRPFNIDGAVKAGYSKGEIIDHLSSQPALNVPGMPGGVPPGPPKPPLPKSDRVGVPSLDPTDNRSLGRKILEWPAEGVGLAAQGIEQIADVNAQDRPPAPDVSPLYAPKQINPSPGQQVAGGTSKVIRGTAQGAAPLLTPAAAVAAPGATAVGLTVGTGAQGLTKAGLDAAGVEPEYSDLASDVVGGVAGGVAAHGATRPGKPAPGAPPPPPPPAPDVALSRSGTIQGDLAAPPPPPGTPPSAKPGAKLPGKVGRFLAKRIPGVGTALDIADMAQDVADMRRAGQADPNAPPPPPGTPQGAGWTNAPPPTPTDTPPPAPLKGPAATRTPLGLMPTADLTPETPTPAQSASAAEAVRDQVPETAPPPPPPEAPAAPPAAAEPAPPPPPEGEAPPAAAEAPPAPAPAPPEPDTRVPLPGSPNIPGALTPYDTPEIIAARARLRSIPSTIDNLRADQLAQRDARAQATMQDTSDPEVAPGGTVDSGKQAYLVMGPPAAGKSTISDPLAAQTKSMVVDSDIAKKTLQPEYGNGEGAGAVHEESGIIGDKVFQQAADQGLNIVHPIVGKSIGRVRAMRDALVDRGYQVHLVIMDLPAEQAAQRAVARYGHTGRLVDPYYILNDVKDLPARNYDTLLKEGGFSSYGYFSNDVPRGQSPAFDPARSRNFAGLESLRQGGTAERAVLAEGPGGPPAKAAAAAAGAGQPAPQVTPAPPAEHPAETANRLAKAKRFAQALVSAGVSSEDAKTIPNNYFTQAQLDADPKLSPGWANLAQYLNEDLPSSVTRTGGPGTIPLIIEQMKALERTQAGPAVARNPKALAIAEQLKQSMEGGGAEPAAPAAAAPVADAGRRVDQAVNQMPSDSDPSFYVFRVQKKGANSLANRNAADLLGTGQFLDSDSQEFTAGGDSIAMYRVTPDTPGQFGGYNVSRGGQLGLPDGIGKQTNPMNWGLDHNQSNWYSFGSRGYQAQKVAEVPTSVWEDNWKLDGTERLALLHDALVKDNLAADAGSTVPSKNAAPPAPEEANLETAAANGPTPPNAAPPAPARAAAARAGRGRGRTAPAQPAVPAGPAVPSATPGATGAETLIRIPGEETAYNARYAVRDIGDVQASHDPITFQKNPRYQLQNDRNYTDPSNSERIVRQVKGFDPEIMLTSAPNPHGSPIIDSQGNALSGNSRTMTLQRVYQERPEAAAVYRQKLMDRASIFGLDPAAIEKMQQPILVREIPDTEWTKPDLTKQGSITDFNKVATAPLTSAERATADARRLTPDLVDYLSQQIEATGPTATLADTLGGRRGGEIVNRLTKAGVFTGQERPQLIDSRTGAVTSMAKERIAKMLNGQFFQDSEQYDRTPPELRNKLERTAAPLMRLRGKPEWDLLPDMQDAVDLLEYARAHGQKNLGDATAQESMFGGGPQFSPKATALAEAIQTQNPTTLARMFRDYAAGSEESMFEQRTPDSVFSQVFGGGGGSAAAPAKAAPPPAPAVSSRRAGQRGSFSLKPVSEHAAMFQKQYHVQHYSLADEPLVKRQAVTTAYWHGNDLNKAWDKASALSEKYGENIIVVDSNGEAVDVPDGWVEARDKKFQDELERNSPAE